MKLKIDRTEPRSDGAPVNEGHGAYSGFEDVADAVDRFTCAFRLLEKEIKRTGVNPFDRYFLKAAAADEDEHDGEQ